MNRPLTRAFFTGLAGAAAGLAAPSWLCGRERPARVVVFGAGLAGLSGAQRLESAGCALSFFSGFADEAYRLADAFRARGKKVVAGVGDVSIEKLWDILKLSFGQQDAQLGLREPFELLGLERDHDDLRASVPPPAALHPGRGHDNLVTVEHEVAMLARPPVLDAVRLVSEVDQDVVLLEDLCRHLTGLRLEILE